MGAVLSWQGPSHCNSLRRPILSSPFLSLTTFYAASSPARWHWLCKTPLRPRQSPYAKATADKTPPATVICLPHYARLLSGWQWKNSLQVKASILQSAIAIQDSLFSISKDTSTITMPRLSRLALPEAGFSYQNSLPVHLVFQQRLAHWPEQLQSARRCNRSRSTTLSGVKRSQSSCRPSNMQSALECRTLCRAPMLLWEIWNLSCKQGMTQPLSGLESERFRATT